MNSIKIVAYDEQGTELATYTTSSIDFDVMRKEDVLIIGLNEALITARSNLNDVDKTHDSE